MKAEAEDGAGAAGNGSETEEEEDDDQVLYREQKAMAGAAPHASVPSTAPVVGGGRTHSQLDQVVLKYEALAMAEQSGMNLGGGTLDDGVSSGTEASDDDVGGGRGDDAESGDEGDTGSVDGFIDDSEVHQARAAVIMARKQRPLHGDWFVMKGGGAIQAEELPDLEAAHTPSAAAKEPSTEMSKSLANRERSRRSFIREHKQSSVEWRESASASTLSALKALEAAASQRSPIPFTPGWRAKKAGLIEAPDWPYDLDALLSDLDAAVLQDGTSQRSSGYICTLLEHAVPFSEGTVKRHLNRLERARSVESAWSQLQSALDAVGSQGGSLDAATNALAAVKAYHHAVVLHRKRLNKKDRNALAALYRAHHPADLPNASLLCTGLRGSAASQRGKSLMRAGKTGAISSAPAGPDSEVFWQAQSMPPLSRCTQLLLECVGGHMSPAQLSAVKGLISSLPGDPTSPDAPTPTAGIDTVQESQEQQAPGMARGEVDQQAATPAPARAPSQAIRMPMSRALPSSVATGGLLLRDGAQPGKPPKSKAALVCLAYADGSLPDSDISSGQSIAHFKRIWGAFHKPKPLKQDDMRALLEQAVQK